MIILSPITRNHATYDTPKLAKDANLTPESCSSAGTSEKNTWPSSSGISPASSGRSAPLTDSPATGVCRYAWCLKQSMDDEGVDLELSYSLRRNHVKKVLQTFFVEIPRRPGCWALLQLLCCSSTSRGTLRRSKLNFIDKLQPQSVSSGQIILL